MPTSRRTAVCAEPVDQRAGRLLGEPAALRLTGERDAELGLGSGRRREEADVADQRVGRVRDRDLQPLARPAERRLAHLNQEVPRPVVRDRIPALVAGDLGIVPVGLEARQVVPAEPAQDDPRRRPGQRIGGRGGGRGHRGEGMRRGGRPA
jgi:hypothetical protein